MTSTDESKHPTNELLSGAHFTVGNEPQFASMSKQPVPGPEDAEAVNRLNREWTSVKHDLNIRLGTLLKADNVSVLLGAGASAECGGPLIGSVPIELEWSLLERGISRQGKQVRKWLRCFYTVVRRLDSTSGPDPRDGKAILDRQSEISSCDCPKELNVNVERLLERLQLWIRFAATEISDIRFSRRPPVAFSIRTVQDCLNEVKTALAELCVLPRGTGDTARGIVAYSTFLRKLLTRPLNLKRTNVFTLNYDTLVEQAADSLGITLIDGFVGSIQRTFRPESYDQDLYYPAETTEGSVHRHERVLQMYKLHGSINWTGDHHHDINPYGIISHQDLVTAGSRALIFPTPAKSEETLAMPYSELIRRFRDKVVRRQSVLFVIGYGYGDDHINNVIRQALAIPSFTIVSVSRSGPRDFLKLAADNGDRRIWTVSGTTWGTFTGFVEHALPDLRDEEIRHRVQRTLKLLNTSNLDESGDDDG